MIKLISLITITAFFFFAAGPLSQAYAQVENIESVEAAKELAADAGGTFIEGEAPPALSGDQIALPVIDEASGKILGHVVAEKESLISSLNAAGYTEVAKALAAAEAGTVSGKTVGAGFLGGTAGAIAVGVAVVVGIALAVGSGGGGGGGTTASHH